MGKLINRGWYKESDPFYTEGWTMSVSLGLKPASKERSTKDVEVEGKDPIANAIQSTEGALQATYIKKGEGLPWGKK